MSFIIIYITTADKAEAKRIADHLLHRKLVACANMFPIKSSYWWKSEIIEGDEYVCLVKTTNANWEKVKKEVLTIHAYETPCIMKMDANANESYEHWIQSEVE